MLRRKKILCTRDIHEKTHLQTLKCTALYWMLRGSPAAAQSLQRYNQKTQSRKVCEHNQNIKCFYILQRGPCEQPDPTTAQRFRTNPKMAQKGTAVSSTNRLDIASSRTHSSYKAEAKRAHVHILDLLGYLVLLKQQILKN